MRHFLQSSKDSQDILCIHSSASHLNFNVVSNLLQCFHDSYHNFWVVHHSHPHIRVLQHFSTLTHASTFSGSRHNHPCLHLLHDVPFMTGSPSEVFHGNHFNFLSIRPMISPHSHKNVLCVAITHHLPESLHVVPMLLHVQELVVASF